MPQCITANPTYMHVEDLEESGVVYTVRVTSTAPTLRIYFVPLRIDGVVGTVGVQSVSPSGPSYGGDWVEFTTSQLGTEYTIVLNYTDPTTRKELGPPLYTPTKSPKFKPQTTCPTSSEE
ncbi:hypothetical protein [Nannocystis sp. SCPEA4]|uniref:hypothetical protein n=1 Tax=Nannocystis sp. SCPEA4 TaxID=2996787 RepID=UPI00226DFB2C|nr:hypothetical protein [Nannocystis sp. SCPEA4]MCY1055750.1 hypothetical protein [Nannocystis sp. SCPEA4]